jgi:hypothetical protein
MPPSGPLKRQQGILSPKLPSGRSRLAPAFIGGTCKGASFDSSGATPVGEGTGHFVVTRGGDRIDSFITKRVVYVSSTNHVNTNTVGDFSFSGTQLRQTTQNEQ